jgi:hypothetical protein
MCGNQIFKKSVPIGMLFDLLDKICIKYEKYYYIDMNAFNKMKFFNYHIDFFDSLREYYHLSKLFYLERTVTYNSFTNIIRQICKNHSVRIDKKIKYNESQYNIDYFVYTELVY